MAGDEALRQKLFSKNGKIVGEISYETVFTIMALSTDFYNQSFLDGYCIDQRNVVKNNSRLFVKKFMNGGTSFFYNDKVFGDLGKLLSQYFLDIEVQFFDEWFYVVKDRNFKIYSDSIDLIHSISLDIFFENIAGFRCEMNDRDLVLIIKAHEFGYPPERNNFTEDLWLNSNSDWDRYLIKVLDDTPEALSNVYHDFIDSDFRNLSLAFFWKKSFSRREFFDFHDLIIKEGKRRIAVDNFPGSVSELEFLFDMIFPGSG